MKSVERLIDKQVLRGLVPLDTLSEAHFESLQAQAVIEELGAGSFVCNAGDRDDQSIYLLEGRVELLDSSGVVIARVESGTDESRFPVAHKQPRQLSVRVVGDATVARINSRLLDVMLTWEETENQDQTGVGVGEDSDWLSQVLQTRIFMKLPPSNIQQLLMRLDAISVSEGEVIVTQGEPGEYFYIVKSGVLTVTHHASADAKDVVLAELSEGDSFGEDALISGSNRNATVTMATDGALLRLSKSDFNDLLRRPMVRAVDFELAEALVADGAKWLDVRLPGEYANQSIPDSINLPLSALRYDAQSLSKDHSYILYCDSGRRSSTGAFVLSQLGFDVCYMIDGLMAVPDHFLGIEPGPIEDEESTPPHLEVIADIDQSGTAANEREDSSSNDVAAEFHEAIMDSEEEPGESPELKIKLGELSGQIIEQMTELDELRQKKAALEDEKEGALAKMIATEGQMAILCKEHDEEVSSIRGVMDQIQSERENLLAEQDRLMTGVNDAGHLLEEERANHKDAVHRLRMDLDNAEEENRQLIEVSRASVEDERQSRDMLKCELQETAAERDKGQEALVGAQKELKAMHLVVERAQAAVEEERGAFELTSELAAEEQNKMQAALTVFKHERDEARSEKQSGLAQIGELGAELEIARSLIEMQPNPEDIVPKIELELTTRNLDEAISLCTQADRALKESNEENQRLRDELKAVHLKSLLAKRAEESAGDVKAASQKIENTVVLDRKQVPMNATPSRQSPSYKGIFFGLLVGSVLMVVALLAWERYQETNGKKFTAPATTMRNDKPVKPFSMVKGVPVELPGKVQKKIPEPKKKSISSIVTKRVVAQPARSFSDSLIDGGDGPRMVQLRADEFAMGSGSTSPNFDERPQRNVTLDRYAIGRHEVTFADYARFMVSSGRLLPEDTGQQLADAPVVGISWQDAVDYTQWLSKQTGYHYRLPSEAEWEYAARGGNGGRYSWGSALEENRANCFGCSDPNTSNNTLPVGSFASNSYGLHDMTGNAREWVQDCYQTGYTNAPLDGGAVTLENCSAHVIRGGSFSTAEEKIRSASRDHAAGDSRLDDLGFRVVRE